MSFENPDGKNIINNPGSIDPFLGNNSDTVPSKQSVTPTERRSFPSATSSDTLPPPMWKIGESNQGKQPPGAKDILSPARLLDQRLESAGAYERVEQFDPQ